MTPEGKVKKAFVDAAKKHGLRYINLICTGDDGDPDKIALPPGGVPAFIEFKRPDGGQLSVAQEYKVAVYRRLGYRVFIISHPDAARALARGLMEQSGWSTVTESDFVAYCLDHYA